MMRIDWGEALVILGIAASIYFAALLIIVLLGWRK